MSTTVLSPLSAFTRSIRPFSSKENARHMLSIASTQQNSTQHMDVVRSSVEGTLRPAKQVGLFQSGNDELSGALPFVLARVPWESLVTDISISVRVTSTGDLLYKGKVIGHTSELYTHIGHPVRAVKPTLHSRIDQMGYCPIYQRVGKQDRVVGFGAVQIRGTYATLTITKHNQQQASPNASTAWNADMVHLTAKELNQVFAINRALNGAVLAPALI